MADNETDAVDKLGYLGDEVIELGLTLAKSILQNNDAALAAPAAQIHLAVACIRTLGPEPAGLDLTGTIEPVPLPTAPIVRSKAKKPDA